jgi:AraC-like DNA-binding protein
MIHREFGSSQRGFPEAPQEPCHAAQAQDNPCNRRNKIFSCIVLRRTKLRLKVKRTISCQEMRHEQPFRHSLPVPDEIFHLPIYVTTAGWEIVEPGQKYPFPDASINGFEWNDGRELPEFCLAWMDVGAGHLETKQGEQTIPTRRAFFFRPGEWHRHRPENTVGWTIYWINFNGSLPHHWMQNGEFQLDGNLPLIEDIELFRLQLVRLIMTIHQSPTTNAPGLSWQAAGLLSHFVTHGGKSQEVSQQLGDNVVNRAIQFIWNHSHNLVDVSEVVAAAGCSRRVLERRFIKVMNRSVLEEIQRCRLNRAMRLLRETSLPFKQVVYRAGLRSRQQLWALFQSQLGISPEEYRKNRNLDTPD